VEGSEVVPKEGGHAGPPLPVGGDLCVAPSVAVHNRIWILLGQPLEFTTRIPKEPHYFFLGTEFCEVQVSML
jgi:hypothetical protein